MDEFALELDFDYIKGQSLALDINLIFSIQKRRDDKELPYLIRFLRPGNVSVGIFDGYDCIINNVPLAINHHAGNDIGILRGSGHGEVRGERGFPGLLHGRDLPAGITLIVLVLTVMLGSLMISLGIIGSYLFRVYQEVLNRPRYLITEKINC